MASELCEVKGCEFVKATLRVGGPVIKSVFDRDGIVIAMFWVGQRKM